MAKKELKGDIQVLADPFEAAESADLLNSKTRMARPHIRMKANAMVHGSLTEARQSLQTEEQADLFLGEGRRAKEAKSKKGGGKSKSSTTTTGGYKSCWTTHKPLPIVVGETTYHVHGGSCHYPPDGMDVYVGLDSYMAGNPLSYPWNRSKGIAFRYGITDMHAPADPVTFKQLIGWLAKQLKAGKKVHIGCIGGHGRTGTVLSALVAHMTGMEDATGYVRKHYCKKAVESQAQIDFLYEHFGVKKVDPTKGMSYATGSYSGGSGYQGYWDTKSYAPKDSGTGVKEIRPVQVDWTIHTKGTTKVRV